MTDVLDCPACNKAVTVGRELFGRVMACPHCARHFTVPNDGRSAILVASPSSNIPLGTPTYRFTFSCMRCASVLEARGEHCGTMGRCPTCGAVFTIPAVDPRTGRPSTDAHVDDDGQLPTPMHAYATAGTKAPKIIRTADGEGLIQCPRCDRNCPADANQCPTCGTPFTMDGADAVIHGSSQSNGLASAAITVSLLGFCIPYVGLVGAGLGLAAMRRSQEMGQARPGYGMAVAALVIGLISFAIHAARRIF